MGQFSARQAAMSPISVRRIGEQKPPKKHGAFLLVPGLGVIGGYCVLSVMGRDPSGGSASSLLVPSAVLMTGAGLVFGLAPITTWLAQRLAWRAKSLSVALAMRRTEVDSGSSLRVVTGLVLLVFGASLTQGVLVELDQISRRTAPLQEYNIRLNEVSPTQREEMIGIPGVQSSTISYGSWDPLDGSDVGHADLVVGTCAQLAMYTERATGCTDGQIMQLRDDRTTYEYDPKPGEQYTFALKNGRKITFTVPHERIDVHPWGLSVFESGALLVPPSLLPADLADADGSLTLLSNADPTTIRSVLDGIGAIAPTVSVEPVGIVIDSLAQLTVIRSLLVVGMVLGLVIGVAAFVVSVADRAMERRGQVTALALLGARAGTLRVVQVVQVVLPLVVGLGAAIVAGWLAESSYLITGGGAVHWDWEGLPLLFVCALGVVLAAALASVPMVRRHIDPEHIRRD
ncbi:FtsX-like permease family protein [Streptomyces sp. NPDC088757]|uniref:FtsX-like permease family protein n=1 Tax=Streptomyces sp. NPDC088757 TaxID=3365889 RepID=UPI0037F1771B